MLTDHNINQLLKYFVDGTELSREEMNTLLKFFLIERIDDTQYIGYVLTITGKTLLRKLTKKDNF